MSICANCPTPQRMTGGAPLGECPVCGAFWSPMQSHNGTMYGFGAISREDYQAWMRANGHGTNPPAVHKLPNVVTLRLA
jgi:hypothetical protein